MTSCKVADVCLPRMICIFISCDVGNWVRLLPKEACCAKGMEIVELLAQLFVELCLLTADIGHDNCYVHP